MAKYLKTTQTYNHKKYGIVNTSSSGGENYKKVWYNLEFDITVAADGTITYKITSTNNADSITGWVSHGCKVSAWIEINGSTVLSTKYYASTTGPTGATSFPYKNNSTYSGTLSKDENKATGKSITIKSRIMPGSDYSGHSTEWANSLSTSTLTRTEWTNVSAGSVSITDNFNNSYTVEGTGGSAGTNNAVTSATLTYPNASGTDVTADCKGKTTTKKVAFTPSGADDTKTIKASVQTVGTYNTPGAVSASLKVKQYEGPSPATSLRIGYNKSRFTLKEPWVLSWQEPATNYSCPIRGYRIHLYRKRGNILTIATAPWVNLPIYDQNGRYISTKVVSSGDVYCELDYSEYGENLPTSLTIYPEYYNSEEHPDEPDIKPGDYISFSVSAYTKYGKNYDGTATDADGQKLCFKSGANESYFINNSSVGKWDTNPEVRGHLKVQNAGVVRVKTASGWKEGQVHVRVNGKWVEAETVNVKSGSSWKEAE